MASRLDRYDGHAFLDERSDRFTTHRDGDRLVAQYEGTHGVTSPDDMEAGLLAGRIKPATAAP